MKPSVQRAVEALAVREGLDPAALLAFVEVEAGGVPFVTFDGKDWPLIRYEGHYLFRRLASPVRELAVKAGFADRNVGGVPNPRSQEQRYELLFSAAKFLEDHGQDKDLAFRSVSVGLGQVMGSNFADLGYSSAEAMLKAMHDETAEKDLEDQVGLMVSFLKVNGLIDDLKRQDWKALARGYNGPGYARNRYDKKLAEAHANWLEELAGSNTEIAEDEIYSGLLTVGSRGPMVKFLQEELKRLGYNVGKLDGFFGRETRAQVFAFQADENLTVDGIVGPTTWNALRDSKGRVLSETRRSASVADLRKEGSSTVKKADTAQGIAVAAASAGAVAEVVPEDLDFLGSLENIGGLASSVSTVVRSVAEAMSSNWPLMLLVLGLAGAWAMWRVKRQRLEDHRSGKNMGR